MFDPFLSCSSFLLPSTRTPDYMDFVRRRIGSDDLEPDRHGMIRWERSTKVKIGGDKWYQPAPSSGIDLTSHQALMHLGTIEDSHHRAVEVYTFVSPFASVAASFEIAARKYLGEHGRQDDAIPEPALNLNKFLVDAHLEKSVHVTSVEGIQPDGAFVTVTVGTDRMLPDNVWNLDLSAVSARISGRRVAKVYKDFHIELDDVSADFSEVSASLTEVFEIFRAHIVTDGPPVTFARAHA